MMLQMLQANFLLVAIVAGVGLFFSTLMFLASRYKRCPSDQILVIFGKVGEGQSARCIHGGGSLVWPLIQDYAYMSLTPMTISIPLQKALSMQNIRINVPSTFTVGISTESGIMGNAAERLLKLSQKAIEEMAKEIIFGQLRLTVASLTIEQINQDRERFLDSIRKNVAPELNKIGLYLINVNITDITDESGYIDSIGKKAASEAINQARVDVAEQEKKGAIGQSEAAREKDIKVAENQAESVKGIKKTESDKRIHVQQLETAAAIGEADALRVKDIKVSENMAATEKGVKKAEADKRVFMQQQEAEAVEGENQAQAAIVQANAALAVKQAESLKLGEVARLMAQVEIQKAQAKAEAERLTAVEVVQKEIEKRKIEISAEAEAEKRRRIAKGEADGEILRSQAEATGTLQVLESKAEGYRRLVESCNGDAKAAATLLMTEKIEQIVAMQVEAIKNIKIDKITVWDSGSDGNGGNTTSNFLSGMVRSLPPLHEVAAMAGVELPTYLGEVGVKKSSEPSAKPAT